MFFTECSFFDFLPFFVGILKKVEIFYDKAADFAPVGCVSNIFGETREDNDSRSSNKCSCCNGTGFVDEDDTTMDVAVFGTVMGVFSTKKKCPACGGSGIKKS